jgi:hypothetical protein
MAGYAGLALAKHLRQLPYGEFHIPQQGQNTQAGLVSQCLKDRKK